MRWGRRLRASLLALLAAGALAIAPSPASAHDQLVSSDPAASQTVPHVPSAVALTFEEPPVTMGIQVVVTGPEGPVQQGSPKLAGLVVTQGLQGGAPQGTYEVAWRVTSDDGHPVSGTFTFTAQAAGLDASPAPTALPVTPPGSHGTIWLVAGLLAAVAIGLLAWRRSRLRSPLTDSRSRR